MNARPLSSFTSLLLIARTAALVAALLAVPCVHAADVTWSSTGTSTAGGNGNWTGGSTWWNGSSAVSWTASDNATFSAAGNTTVNSAVSVGSITFTNSAANISILGGAGDITLNSGITATNTANTTARTYTISESIALGANQTWTVNNGGTTGTANLAVSGIISGSNLGITKAGNGTLTLSGTNTYTGATTVDAGILVFSGTQAKAPGTVTAGAAGTIGLGVGGANSYTSANVAALFGNTLSGFSLNAASGVAVDTTGGNFTVTDALSGTRAFTKLGPNTLTLTGNNTYTGATTISNGTLEIGSAGRLGRGSYARNIANSGTLIYSGTNNQTLSGILSGTGALTQNGTGTLTLTGNNTYTGATTISNGTLEIGSAGRLGRGSYAGDITNNGTFLYNGTNSQTLSGVISGTGAFTKNNTSTITLSGANSYTGTTAINAGVLRASNATALGTTANGTTVASGAALELSGGISIGAEALSLSGTGISSGGALRNISGDNSYAGAITLAAATRINSDAGSLTLSGAISGTQNLTFGGAGNTTVSGNITTSTGTLTKDGAGTLTLSGAGSSYTGTTTLSAGTIQIGHANALGSGGNITFGGGGLKYGTGITQDLSSRIKNSGSAILVDTNGESVTWGTALDSTNAGGLTKNGTGTLTLSATNTYNGSTTINGGTLQVDGDISNSGLVMNSGGIISPGTTAAADSFGTSSLTINGGGFNWSLTSANGSAGSGWDQITSTGALTSSGLLTVYAYGTPGDWDGSASYSWDIISAANLSGVFDSTKFALNLSNFGIAAGNRTGTWSFSNPSGGNITLAYTAPSGDPVWAGGTGNWDAEFTPAVSQGDSIAFAGAGGIATNNISNSTLTTVNDIDFRQGAGAYTLAANAGSAGASGGMALSVNGSIINNSLNTQTLNTDLAFAATRTVDARIGNITIGGAISGAGGLTKNGSLTLTLSGNNTYTGATTISSGTLEIGNGGTTGTLNSSTYGVTNNGTLVFNRSDSITVGNLISGTGHLTQNGTGTLTLSGNNTYTGTTTINAGTLATSGADKIADTSDIVVNSGGVLSLGGAETVASISGAGNITLGANTLTTNSSSSTTYSGILSGTGGLTQNGTGTLTLSGNNTYSGGTTVNSGTILGSHLKSFGNNTISLGANGTIRLTAAASASTNAFIAGAYYSDGYKNAVTGNGVIELVSGSSFYSVNYSGDLSGFNGTLSATSASGQYVGFGSNNGNSIPNLSGNSTRFVISGAGHFLPMVASGGTIAMGELSGNGYIVNPYTYNANYLIGALSTNSTFSGAFIENSGILSLSKVGTGTLTLSGNNTYRGATTISSGTLEIGSAGRLGGGSYAGNISNNGTLIYSGTNNQTLSGILSGTGGLTQNGTGTLTLSGANTYTGATIIHGNLTAAVTDAMGSTTSVVINSGGSLLVGANETINNSANMTLAGGTLEFGGNFTEKLGSLTLTANSVIDMGGGNIWLEFMSLAAELDSTTRLNIYNYELYADHIYFGSDANLAESLPYISFYSGWGTGFIGDSFVKDFTPLYEVRPVPEPETWATGLLLLLGGGAWMWRQRKAVKTQATR